MQTGSEDVRSKLISVARTIFAENGYNKATVDDIAKSSGKAKSSLYYYFSSKEDIFKAVIDKEAQLFRSKILESISIDASSSEKIKNYITNRLLVFNELINFFKAISDNSLEQLPCVDNTRKQYEQEQLNIIKMVLFDAANNGELDVSDVNLVAETIAVVLKGLEYNIIFQPEALQGIKEKVDKVINLIYKGIMKR